MLNYFRMLLNSEVVYVFLKKFCFSVRCAIKHNLTFFLNRFVRLFSGFSCGRLSLRRFFLMKRKCFVSFKVFHGKFRYCKRLFKRRRRYRCLKKSLRGAAGV